MALALFCVFLGAHAGGLSSSRESMVFAAPTFELTLEVRPDGAYTAGVASSFTVIVTNHGPVPTTGNTMVRPIAELPSSFASVTADGPGWTCTTGIAAECTTAEVVAPGATFTPLTYHFTPTDSSVPIVLYVMGVQALAGSENTVDNTAGCLTVAPSSDPAMPRFDLSVGVSPVAGFAVDQATDFSIVVTNQGPLPTTGTTCVAWSAPEGASLQTASGAVWTCNPGTVIFCQSDAVVPGGGSFPPLALSFTYNAAGTPSVNSFRATVWSPWESAPGNDTTTVPMVIAGGVAPPTTTTPSIDTTTSTAPLPVPGTPLPATGASSGWQLAAALGLVALGGAALTLSRRSRTSA